MNEVLKLYARSYYDFQMVKNEFGGRLRASEGIEKMPAERKEELEKYNKQLEIAEGKLLKVIEPYLEELPIYTEFLKPIRGCALRMSACMVTSIGDIRRFPTISKLWAYAGLHVKEGRAVRRKAGEKSNWNSFLKTKLHVLSDCLMKLNHDHETGEALRYRKFYDDYKLRIESRPTCDADYSKVKSKAVTYLPNGYAKGHVHNMALRYIQKMFLQDYWMKSWELLGEKPPTAPYAEAVLGRVHGEYPKAS